MKTFIRLARMLQAYNSLTYEEMSSNLDEKIKDKTVTQPLIRQLKCEPV